MSDAVGVDGARPARVHAAAERGDARRGRDGSTAAAEILQPPERRSKGSAQRAVPIALQDASAKAAEMLKSSCQTGEAITPPARLEAAGKRLETMLQAIKTVRAPLDSFYATLSDEQKAQFEAIGPRRA